MTSSSDQYRVGLLFVTIAAVAWSTSGLFTRFLTAVDIPTILFWRGLLGATCTFIVIHFGGRFGISGNFRDLGLRGVSYAVVTAISMLLFIGALVTTSVAHVAVITATVPFLAAFLGWTIFREIPRQSAMVASGTALIGVSIMVGISSDGRLAGDLMALLMALCMAGMILISRRFGNIPALPATALASALTAAATLPFASAFEVTAADFEVLLLFALVNQVLGFGIFALGARKLPPMETALITALDAPLAPLWVWLVFSETPGQSTFAGGTIVFAAVLGHILLSHRKTS